MPWDEHWLQGIMNAQRFLQDLISLLTMICDLGCEEYEKLEPVDLSIRGYRKSRLWTVVQKNKGASCSFCRVLEWGSGVFTKVRYPGSSHWHHCADYGSGSLVIEIVPILGNLCRRKGFDANRMCQPLPYDIFRWQNCTALFGNDLCCRERGRESDSNC